MTVRSNIVPNISESNPVSALALGQEPDDPPLGWISSNVWVTDEPGVTVFHSPFSLLILITWIMNSTVTSSANPNTENVTIFIAFFTLSALTSKFLILSLNSLFSSSVNPDLPRSLNTHYTNPIVPKETHSSLSIS